MLNSTQAGLRLYAATGFKIVTTLSQHQGVAGAMPPPPASKPMRSMCRDDHAALIALDAAATGMPRAAMLMRLLEHAEGVVLECDGAIAGFSLCRRFGRGHVVGPVVAPDTQGAQLLIAHWLAARPGQFVRVDVPAHATATSLWLAELGLQPAGGGTTMIRGVAPTTTGSSQLFALVSQATG